MSSVLYAVPESPAVAVASTARATPAGSPATVGSPCRICHLKEVCFPCDLVQERATHVGQILSFGRPVKKGESLFRSGDRFQYLYTVNAGSFKSVRALSGGGEQVTGFQLTGDLLGADGIAVGVHGCGAVALEDSRVCSTLYSRIESLDRTAPGVQQNLRKVMSAEILHNHHVMLHLVMTAEERIASFLLGLSQRLAARGNSPTKFTLCMSRQEIGSYVGVSFETVSRTLSRFREAGLLRVHRQHILDLDIPGLTACVKRHVH